MESPRDEISDIVPLLLCTDSPDEQKKAVMDYFTENASFSHPLCKVWSAPNSRDKILGVYQFCRILSPKIEVDVLHVVYNTDTNTLIIDASHLFHLRFSPFKPLLSNLKVYLKLTKKLKRYYIASQDNYYQPDELFKSFLPPVVPLVNSVLAANRYVTGFSTGFAQFFGYWRISGKESVSEDSDNAQVSGDNKGEEGDQEGLPPWHKARRAKHAKKREQMNDRQESPARDKVPEN